MNKTAFILLLVSCLTAAGCANTYRPEDIALIAPKGASESNIERVRKTPAPSQAVEERKVELPEDVSTATFEQLWFVSCQWQVGTFMEVIKKARAELRRRGKGILPDVLGQMPYTSGLVQRAFVDYFRSLGDDAVAPICNLLDDEKKRGNALDLIYTLKLKEAIPALKTYMESPDKKFAAVVLRILAYLGDKSVSPKLIEQYREAPELSRLRILRSLQKLQDPSLAGFFIEECGDEFVSIRRLAQNCLVTLGGSAAKAIIRTISSVKRQQHYRCLLEALGRIAAKEDTDALMRGNCIELFLQKADVVNEKQWPIRFSAIRALQLCKKTISVKQRKLLSDIMASEKNLLCRRELARLLQEDIEWKKTEAKPR